MHLGVNFPSMELESDPVQFRELVQAIEAMGYEYVLVPDHVLGADPDRHPSLPGPYRYHDVFHEPFVLLSYFAATTDRLGLGTNVLVLPQRQTALVAKQAAELDVLSGGRLRLGVGTGWNYLEFECLGMDYSDRGRRIEEQVEVLRALWTQPRVDFQGRWHKIDAAGINPLPVQRPIPIWFGGGTPDTNASPGAIPRIMDRIGRLGDGWLPVGLRPLSDEAHAALEQIAESARRAGRNPDAIGLEGRVRAGRVTAGRGGPDAWASWAQAWRDQGATHLTFWTMTAGFTSLDEHLDALRRFKDIVDKQ